MSRLSNKLCTCCPVHKDTYKILVRTLRKQNMMQATLSQLLNETSKLRSTKPLALLDDGVSVFSKFDFPIDSLDELIKLEAFLAEPVNFNLVVYEISKIGGSTVYDFIRRTAGRILTDKFASEYSWLGAKKKRVFCNLKLGQLLIESVQHNYTTKTATRKDIEEAIKNWLRRAKERDENKAKRKVETTRPFL